MWFSPVKGAYMTLGQIDKTLPYAATSGKELKRGMIMAVASDTNAAGDEGKFELNTGTQTSVPYVALQGELDYQAGSAGYVGIADMNNGVGTAAYGNGTTIANSKLPAKMAGTRPRVTGLSLAAEGEYQTDCFESGTYTLGAALYVSTNGKLTATASTSSTVVGYVTKVPFRRWINNLNYDNAAARYLGGSAMVLQFAAKYVPGTVASGSSVSALSADAAKTVTAKSAK